MGLRIFLGKVEWLFTLKAESFALGARVGITNVISPVGRWRPLWSHVGLTNTKYSRN